MDKCPACGHDWHGLTCQEMRIDTNLAGPGWATARCRCPSQFVDTPAREG